MGQIQRTIEEELAKTPRIFLSRLISAKLEEIGVNDSPGLAEAMIGHVLAGKTDSFLWDDGRPSSAPLRHIKLSISNEELEDLQKQTLRFFEDEVPKLIENATRSAARHALKALKADWYELGAYEIDLLVGFRARLEERWGDGFDLLRMLLAISREIGEDAQKRFRKSRAKKNLILRSLLLRLHARACQVMAEIITLMENGFADGAMARWRTLYEIGVVATVIVDAGERLAERYVDHDAVESKAALDEHDRCYGQLDYKYTAARHRKRILRAYDAAILKYGKEFGSTYGWAVEYLGLKRPTFRDLEAVVQRSMMRPYYKLASDNVHAGTKGLFYRLGQLSDQSFIIAGASNFGFADPGQNTAFTITQITHLLYAQRKSTLETSIEIQTLILLRDQIVRALGRADRKLRQDHAELS
jgi:hypothetical protein